MEKKEIFELEPEALGIKSYGPGECFPVFPWLCAAIRMGKRLVYVPTPRPPKTFSFYFSGKEKALAMRLWILFQGPSG